MTRSNLKFALAVGGLLLALGSIDKTAGADVVTAGYVVQAPTRVLDTRTSFKPGAGAELTVFSGIPGATAVGVNIALTETDGPGFVTAWNGTGVRPTTSVINSSGPAENISNFVIVPVAPNGSFKLFTNSPTHIVVDVMGGFLSSTVPPTVPPGVTAVITGYGPLTTITEVSGTVSNGTATAKNIRIDVRCPNGTTELDSIFSLPAGQTRGWSVLCTGAFSSGATLVVVEI